MPLKLSEDQSARVAERSRPRRSDFREVTLPDLPKVPGMISNSDRRYLYWLASQGYTGTGAVVEVGTWLGLSTIHLGADSLDALDAAFDAAVDGRISERPLIELTLPSALDPGLAPAGKHVASMFVQYAPYAPTDSSWDIERDRLADRVFALVDEVAPGFTDSVLHREVLAPPDLEREFSLTGGNIFHGAMSLDRLLFMRPTPGWARYRTPVEGLYLCGAGTHPGGGVMGACGRNAAREVIRDLAR